MEKTNPGQAVADATGEALEGQVAILTSEIVTIADGVTKKDEVAVAKLRIEARQWVVETCLRRRAAAAVHGEGRTPTSVTINLDAEPGGNA